MKIEGTEWYTASGTKFTPIEGSERTQVQTFYGYRMSVAGRKDSEVKELMDHLKSDGINAKLKISKHAHTGIPKGTPYLQVLDDESAIALEKVFLKQGIELPTDRYKEYGMEYINRTPKAQVSRPVQKSFWDRLFGRK